MREIADIKRRDFTGLVQVVRRHTSTTGTWILSLQLRELRSHVMGYGPKAKENKEKEASYNSALQKSSVYSYIMYSLFSKHLLSTVILWHFDSHLHVPNTIESCFPAHAYDVEHNIQTLFAKGDVNGALESICCHPPLTISSFVSTLSLFCLGTLLQWSHHFLKKKKKFRTKSF